MKIKGKSWGLVGLLIISVISFMSCSQGGVTVSSAAELTTALETAEAGDTIFLADGIYKDQLFVVSKGGVEGKPITFKAANGGKAILTGNSRIRIGADWVVVDGFFFKDGFLQAMEGAVVEFRMADPTPGSLDFIYCSNSVLRNTVIAEYNNPDRKFDYKWISVYGQYNTVENCDLLGKNNSGTALVVWRPDASPQYHTIRYNKIMYIEEDEDGNGAEGIRIGTSQESLSDSFTTVEYNYFEQCNGEIEIISNKSGENIYQYNTFVNNAGMLTLRHGDGCTVHNNFFIGNNYAGSAGIRVIGEDHQITNNYIESTNGGSSNFRSAICLTNAYDNGPINSYYQVKNAYVANNVLVNNFSNIIIGGGVSDKLVLPPIDCTIENNLVLGQEDGMFLVDYMDQPINMTYKNNTMFGAPLGIEASEEEVKIEEINFKEKNGIFYPNSSYGVKIEGKPLQANEAGAEWARNLDQSDDPAFRKRNLFDEAFEVKVVLPWSDLTKWSGYQGIILLGVNSPDAFIDTTRYKFDVKDETIMPKYEDGEMLIPKAWVEKQFGNAGRTADSDFISLEEFAKKFDKLAHYDDRGFAIIVKDPEYFDLLTIPGTLDTMADIYRVLASSHDGNMPSNVLDSNLDTRWSAEGDGEYVQIRLDEEVELGSVDIAFYKGKDRTTSFSIQTSTDKVNWQDVFTGESSGTSIAFENFKVTPSKAIWVRFVGHGNSSNNWNSITEVMFYDTAGNPVVNKLKARGEIYVEKVKDDFIDFTLEGTPIASIDDAYIEKQSPDKIFGVDFDKIRIKSNIDYSIVRIAYVKFDVSEFDKIEKAVFQISGTVSTNNLPNPELEFDIYGLPDDNWEEETITWNNAPNHELETAFLTGVGETAFKIGTFTMSGPGIAKKYAIDITDFVKEQKDADGMVTLMLADVLMQNGNSDPYSDERSNEKQRPYLYIQ